MLIIIDGDVHDTKETGELIVELSKYPASIIIVGVGKEEFSRMGFFD